MKNLVLFISLVLSFQIFADFSYRVERWESGDTLSFVIRNERGQFAGHGTLRLESWNDGDQVSEWVARRNDGTLVTGGYKGRLEKFSVRGLEREATRLVIRNSKGHFVTWVAVDEFLTSGFERMDFDRDGKKESIYVVRYKGQFVNWAPAKLEDWGSQEQPVLVVRDTNDGVNNGKIMTYVVGTQLESGHVVYRDPKTGRFLSINK